MSQPSVFGHVPGVPVGATFDRRADLILAGLHRHRMRGISGNYGQGADAICLSGGYKDDVDEGDRVLYTGEGGQARDTKIQVQDQKMIQGNMALLLSHERALPVRVIRGWQGASKSSPSSGFRYDGLYMITDHFTRKSSDGPLIFQYVMERVPEIDTQGWVLVSGNTVSGIGSPPEGNQEPGKTLGVTQRIVRNTAVSQWVKQRHDCVCQACGLRLEIDGVGYAEGAHIKALGTPHRGPDVPSNILCLCANDHVLFDRGALYIADNEVFKTSDRSHLSELRLAAGHAIDESFVAYHREKFAGVLL